MAKYQYNDRNEFFGGCSENRVLPSAKRGPLEILTMTYDRDGRVSLITRNDGTRDEYSSDWQTIARRNPNGSTDYLQNTGEIDLGLNHGNVEPKKSAVPAKAAGPAKVASAPVK